MTSSIGSPVTWKERMAVALARDIVDGERIISGAHTEISFAATLLAQEVHAPNIKLLSSPSVDSGLEKFREEAAS